MYIAFFIVPSEKSNDQGKEREIRNIFEISLRCDCDCDEDISYFKHKIDKVVGRTEIKLIPTHPRPKFENVPLYFLNNPYAPNERILFQNFPEIVCSNNINLDWHRSTNLSRYLLPLFIFRYF